MVWMKIAAGVGCRMDLGDSLVTSGVTQLTAMLMVTPPPLLEKLDIRCLCCLLLSMYEKFDSS